MVAVLAFYQTFVSPVVRLGLPVLVILGLWVGLRRAGLTPAARMMLALHGLSLRQLARASRRDSRPAAVLAAAH